jgi:hypothetical protein
LTSDIIGQELTQDDLLVILSRAMYVEQGDDFESIRLRTRRFQKVLNDIIPALNLQKIVQYNADSNHCCWHVQEYCQFMIRKSNENIIPITIQKKGNQG